MLDVNSKSPGEERQEFSILSFHISIKITLFQNKNLNNNRTVNLIEKVHSVTQNVELKTLPNSKNKSKNTYRSTLWPKPPPLSWHSPWTL